MSLNKGLLWNGMGYEIDQYTLHVTIDYLNSKLPGTLRINTKDNHLKPHEIK